MHETDIVLNSGTMVSLCPGFSVYERGMRRRIRKWFWWFLCVLCVYIIFRNVRLWMVSLGSGLQNRQAEMNVVDYMSVNLSVKYEVVDNLNKMESRIHLQNIGDSPIKPGPWRIYFDNLRDMSTGDLNCDLRIRHVNGGLFYMTPTSSFRTIQPGATAVCTINTWSGTAARTDIFPNWYVTSPGIKAKRLISTVGETLDFVHPFDTERKWKTTSSDRFNPYKASDRYRMHESVLDLKQPAGHVIPTPVYVKEISAETIGIKLEGWVVLDNADFNNEINILAEALSLPKTNFIPSKRYIQIVRSAGLLDPEAYELEVNTQAEVIKITATRNAGAFYGVQSLISLREGRRKGIPNILIRDKPRFPYRGLMIDVADNFLSKAAILKFLDAMSLYKLNRLHLHLTEDEGWRLEIPGVPELTQIGSKRCHDPENGSSLIPSLGSGPDSATSGSGYYTVADYREILQYAKARHIVVIPEVDMPGHSRAAIQAMKYRNRNLKTGSDAYFLYDHRVTSAGGSGLLGWLDNTVNPCLPTTYTFVDKVITEIIKMHEDIQPLEVFHIGGDEVAKGVWKNSPSCSRIFKDIPANETTTALIKNYFIKRVAKILDQKKLSVAMWEDGILNARNQPYPRGFFSDNDVNVISWGNVWEKGFAGRAYSVANAGFKTILSLATHLYFDHPYEPDPEERGLYWATRFIDTKTVFGFMPLDIYSNAMVTKDGRPISRTGLCMKGPCPKLTEPGNIIGLEGGLWSETIRSEEQFHYMGFPRILALAERAWHAASWENVSDRETRTRLKDKDWETFANALGYKELSRLERHGIQHRVPPPGAIVETLPSGEIRLKVNTLYPGCIVEIFDQQNKRWEPIQQNKTLPRGQSIVKLRSRSAVLGRASREVTITPEVT